MALVAVSCRVLMALAALVATVGSAPAVQALAQVPAASVPDVVAWALEAPVLHRVSAAQAELVA